MDYLFENQLLSRGRKTRHEKKPLIFLGQLPKNKQREIKRILIKYYNNYGLEMISESGTNVIDDFMDSKISSIVGISSDYPELEKIDSICQVYGGYKITAVYDNKQFQYTMYNFGL